MEANPLLARRDGAVLTLTLNRPDQRNAINGELIGALMAALGAARDDAELRAIVLTGAGDKAFCAGADLQSGKSFAFDYAKPRSAFADLLRDAQASLVPIIGRVNGACIAGGMGLLAICDMAIAAEHALFGLPEVKVGVFPMQVLAVLQDLVAPRVLAQMCLTGEPLSATQAQAAGLVNSVASKDGLDSAVAALVARVIDKAPSAIRRGKYAMRAIRRMGFEEAMAFMEGQIGLLALTEDAREGQAAFRERRAAVWTGK